jgi:hypothetical protein
MDQQRLLGVLLRLHPPPQTVVASAHVRENCAFEHAVPCFAIEEKRLLVEAQCLFAPSRGSVDVGAFSQTLCFAAAVADAPRLLDGAPMFLQRLGHSPLEPQNL